MNGSGYNTDLVKVRNMFLSSSFGRRSLIFGERRSLFPPGPGAEQKRWDLLIPAPFAFRQVLMPGPGRKR